MDALRVSTAWVTLDMVFVTGAAWDTAAGGWRVGYFIVNPPGRGASNSLRISIGSLKCIRDFNRVLEIH